MHSKANFKRLQIATIALRVFCFVFFNDFYSSLCLCFFFQFSSKIPPENSVFWEKRPVGTFLSSFFINPDDYDIRRESVCLQASKRKHHQIRTQRFSLVKLYILLNSNKTIQFLISGKKLI